jgi:uroporphyrinogen decarboxylase
MKYAGKRYIDCLLDPMEYVEAEVQCYRRFGHDGVMTMLPMEAVGEALGAKLRFFEDDVPALDTDSPAIKEPKDFEKIIRLDRDIKKHHRIRFLCEIVSGLRQAVGNEAVVMAYAHSVFRLAGMLRGINNLYLDLAMNPEFIKEIQEFCLPKCISFALELVDAGADILIVTNPIANADCISKEMYRTYVYPYAKKLFHAIRKSGAILIFHPCGVWHDRYDLLIDEAPDVLWVDKVDIGWLKAKYGDQICLMGNVNNVSTMLHGTPQDVEKEAFNCITKGSENGGFILSADCLLPRDVPEENLHALVNATKNFGH